MTNGDIRGDSTEGGLIICTAVTGSAGAETPDTTNGETLYLAPMKLTGMYEFLQKIKELSGSISIGTRDGKKARVVTLNDVAIKKWTGGVSVSTNTAAFNSILDWLDGKHDAGDAPFYLFAYNFVDSAYIRLTPNGTRYLKGACQKIAWEIVGGNIYYFKSFDWRWIS